MHPPILRAGVLRLMVLAAPALLAAPAGAQDFTVCQSSAPLLGQVRTSLAKGGLAALTPEQMQAMEQAVTGAGTCFPSFTGPDNSVTMLADGPAETLLAAGSLAGKKVKGTVQFNPFPQLALVLGSYANETGKPQDALQMLDKGLSLSPFPDARLGASLHLLVSEKGAALNDLKRFDEALKVYEDGLNIKNLADGDRARLQRGRGFALTELGRLDEAEEAYKQALALVPDDTRSQHELAYIARVRSGGVKTAPYLTTRPPPSVHQDVPEEQRAKPPENPN